MGICRKVFLWVIPATIQGEETSKLQWKLVRQKPGCTCSTNYKFKTLSLIADRTDPTVHHCFPVTGRGMLLEGRARHTQVEGKGEARRPLVAVQSRRPVCQTERPLAGRELWHHWSKQNKCLTGRDNTKYRILDSSGRQTTPSHTISISFPYH